MGGLVGYIYNNDATVEKQLEDLEARWGPRGMWSSERSLFALGLIWAELRREPPTTKPKAKGLFVVKGKAGSPVR